MILSLHSFMAVTMTNCVSITSLSLIDSLQDCNARRENVFDWREATKESY